MPDFFNRTVSLFQGLNSYQWLSNAGIVPSKTTTYPLSSVQSALAKGFGQTPVVQCSGAAINEIWYYYNVRGSVQSGQFVPVGSDGTTSDCPATVSYIPKSSGSATSTTSTAAATSTSGSGTAFSGKGYLNVINGGSQKGCLISNGKWYTTGTCATYTATASGSGFSLKGSKGFCGVLSDGSIDCTQTTGAVFTSSGSSLVYSGQSTFYAPSVAAGSTQVTVYTATQAQSLTIQWQGQ